MLPRWQPPARDASVRAMDETRLASQIEFILELDRLKEILRQSTLLSGNRRENSAEHSWHTTMLAWLLVEHAEEAIDAGRVMRMLLIHDVVEIDAGDTFLYDTEGAKTKAAREEKAADRLFNLLPGDQAEELRAIWDEFEAGETPDARYAGAADRLMPLLHNLHNGGLGWRKHGIRAGQVLERNSKIAKASAGLWEYAQRLIATAVERGDLKRD